jgi:hypothetical protein
MAGRGLMHTDHQLVVQKCYAGHIADLLRDFENDCEPHSTFVTAVNCLLVWAGARPCTLPAWKYCDSDSIHKFISYLNAISQKLRQPRPAEIITFERQQVYRSKEITVQRLITLRGKPGISFDPKRLVEDDQIGRELGMYPPNTRAFAEGHVSQMAFSVWEAGLDALVYAEGWDEHLLTEAQCQEFLRRCQDVVHLWNDTMESLGFEYRFYGTMDWRRSEIPFHQATNTIRFFGKTHLGTDARVPVPHRALGFHQVNFVSQSPQWTHAVKG